MAGAKLGQCLEEKVQTLTIMLCVVELTVDQISSGASACRQVSTHHSCTRSSRIDRSSGLRAGGRAPISPYTYRNGCRVGAKQKTWLLRHANLVREQEADPALLELATPCVIDRFSLIIRRLLRLVGTLKRAPC